MLFIKIEKPSTSFLRNSSQKLYKQKLLSSFLLPSLLVIDSLCLSAVNSDCYNLCLLQFADKTSDLLLGVFQADRLHVHRGDLEHCIAWQLTASHVCRQSFLFCYCNTHRVYDKVCLLSFLFVRHLSFENGLKLGCKQCKPCSAFGHCVPKLAVRPSRRVLPGVMPGLASTLACCTSCGALTTATPSVYMQHQDTINDFLAHAYKCPHTWQVRTEAMIPHLILSVRFKQ